MKPQSEYQSLSEKDQLEIDIYIQEALVEHLYKTTPGGIITALIVSTMLAVFLHKSASFSSLLSWFIGFNSIQLLILAVYIAYKNFKNKLDTKSWEIAISVLITILSGFYGACVLFMPQEVTRHFLLLAVLLMAASSFSMAAVGLFKLCIASVCAILVPAIIWALSYDSFYYKISGIFIILFNCFLLAMNYRSTEWLKNSLRLTRMLTAMSYSANHDLLTDLPNQHMLANYIEDNIAAVKTTNENFALISFGINRLEMFNNSLGYLASDLIINSISKRLSSQLLELNQLDKKERIITRPRPDAFVILIRPIVPADINQEVNQLFLALNKPFHLGNRESRLTASVGVTIFPQDSNDAEKLLTNTYAAMFEAKAQGGNQIAFYKTAMTSNTPHLLEIENDLNNAILRKEFLVYYQPLVDLKSRKICGVEALIRWHHPERGFVSPIDFIPVAEETGLILPIGEWVLNEALLQTMAWHKKGFDELKVAVNLAAKQLRQGNLIETIDNALKRSGINPRCVELELTETALLDESLTPLISQISKRGISLSIDDFGTGYSGLSYLKHFHIDKIKIDKSFIDDVASSNDSAAIVTATLAMAKELGIKTLAEGVETQEQLAFLQTRECQYIQGYYFSKPLSAQELEHLLTQGVAAKFLD